MGGRRGCLESSDGCLNRRGGFGVGEARREAVRPWRQRLERHSHRLRRTRSPPKLEEARKDRPLELRSQHAPADTLMSGLQEREKAH